MIPLTSKATISLPEVRSHIEDLVDCILSESPDLDEIKALASSGIDLNDKVKRAYRALQSAPPLGWASIVGNVEVISLLLKSGADIEAMGDSQTTPLMYAARYGHKDAVLLLIKNGANTAARNEYSATPQTHADTHEDIQRLLASGITTGWYFDQIHKLNVAKQDNVRKRIYEKYNGYLSRVGLAERGLPEASLDTGLVIVRNDLFVRSIHECEHGSSPQLKLENLTRSIQSDSPNSEEIEATIASDPGIVHRGDKNRKTLLMCAAEKGHTIVITQLLRMRANVAATDKNGLTPLHYAAKKGHIEASKELIIHRANINAENENGSTPLLCAAFRGHFGITDLLLRINANTEVTNKFRNSPLLTATICGHTKVAKLLIEHNANVDVVSHPGNETPLFLAVVEKNKKLVAALTKKKANTEIADMYGRTPLMIAAQLGLKEIAQLLINEGNADIEAKCNIGDTPLIFAAHWGSHAVVQLLVSCGANVNYRGHDAKTAYDHAKEQKHLICCSILEGKAVSKSDADKTKATHLRHSAVVKKKGTPSKKAPELQEETTLFGAVTGLFQTFISGDPQPTPLAGAGASSVVTSTKEAEASSLHGITRQKSPLMDVSSDAVERAGAGMPPAMEEYEGAMGEAESKHSEASSLHGITRQKSPLMDVSSGVSASAGEPPSIDAGIPRGEPEVRSDFDEDGHTATTERKYLEQLVGCILSESPNIKQIRDIARSGINLDDKVEGTYRSVSYSVPPLSWAAIVGNVELVDLLLCSGASTEAVDAAHFRSCMYAAAAKDDTVHFSGSVLMTYGGAEHKLMYRSPQRCGAEEQGMPGGIPLHHAAEKGAGARAGAGEPPSSIEGVPRGERESKSGVPPAMEEEGSPPSPYGFAFDHPHGIGIGRIAGEPPTMEEKDAPANVAALERPHGIGFGHIVRDDLATKEDLLRVGEMARTAVQRREVPATLEAEPKKYRARLEEKFIEQNKSLQEYCATFESIFCGVFDSLHTIRRGLGSDEGVARSSLFSSGTRTVVRGVTKLIEEVSPIVALCITGIGTYVIDTRDHNKSLRIVKMAPNIKKMAEIVEKVARETAIAARFDIADPQKKEDTSMLGTIKTIFDGVREKVREEEARVRDSLVKTPAQMLAAEHAIIVIKGILDGEELPEGPDIESRLLKFTDTARENKSGYCFTRSETLSNEELEKAIGGKPAEKSEPLSPVMLVEREPRTSLSEEVRLPTRVDRGSTSTAPIDPDGSLRDKMDSLSRTVTSLQKKVGEITKRDSCGAGGPMVQVSATRGVDGEGRRRQVRVTEEDSKERRDLMEGASCQGMRMEELVDIVKRQQQQLQEQAMTIALEREELSSRMAVLERDVRARRKTSPTKFWKPA